jgi:hypothetical protein
MVDLRPTTRDLRPKLALVLLIALALLSITPGFFRVALADRWAMERMFTAYPDRPWYPEFPAFLEEVRTHTQRGDTIALVVPAMLWDNNYSYAYYRASYFLSGREVLPLVRRDDSPIPENFARAKYVAAWRRGVKDSTRHVVWAGRGGVLLGH